MPRSSALSRLIELVVVIGALWGVGVGAANGRSRDESVWPRLAGSPAIEKVASTSSGAYLSECLPCAILRAEKTVERWAWKHFPDSFAGMYIDKDDDLVVGFTERQGKRVRAARKLRGVPPNVKVLPFPYVPAHPLAELGNLVRRIRYLAQHDDSIRRRIVSVGIDEPANRVDVGAKRGQVKALARVLRAHFGQHAPIHVHYEEGPVEV